MIRLIGPHKCCRLVHFSNSFPEGQDTIGIFILLWHATSEALLILSVLLQCFTFMHKNLPLHVLKVQNELIILCIHTVTSSTAQMHGFLFPVNLFDGIFFSSCLSTQSMMSLFNTFYHWRLSILSKETVMLHPLLLPMGNMLLHCMLRFWVPWPMLASFLFANDSLLSSKSIRIILPHL